MATSKAILAAALGRNNDRIGSARIKKVWVDDIRGMPDGYNIAIHSVNQAIEWFERELALGKSEMVLVDLDHDAGDYQSDGGDYIRILDWLEANFPPVPYNKIRLVFKIHSANPVGRANMVRIIQRNRWKLA